MSTENALTLQTYEQYGQNYIDDALSDPFRLKKQADLAKVISAAVSGLSKNAKIFEIGSGYGRDAELLQQLGYQVAVSDAANLFLDYLKNHGFSPIKFNAETDEIPGQFDFIMCNAVLVHFPKAQAKAIIQKTYNALTPSGRAYFSVKESTQKKSGSDNRLGGKRYFSYWTFPEFKDFLTVTGFTIIKLEQVSGSRENWLNATVRKEQP